MTRNDLVCPRQSSTTHTEFLGDEASVYDWAQGKVHALNPTAASVWRRCDGATPADEIAVAVHRELGIPDTDAVVDLTLKEFAGLHLLEQPVESLVKHSARTRRRLLERGLAAAMLPAVYTILTPSALEAQSPGGAPTLTSVAPNQGTQGATVAVTLTGTNFVAPATVAVSGAGVTVGAVVVVGPTSLTTSFVIDPAAAVGARTVTVTTPGGPTGTQPFTINAPATGVPTLTSVVPIEGTQGATVAVTLTGTNFAAPATVAVSGAGVTAGAVVVVGPTSLTTSFVIDPAAAVGARTVTVTTPGGTTGTQPFTITAPAPGVPTLTSVVPNQGAQGATVAVTLTGTNFVAPATVAVSGAGVTAGPANVVGPTSLTTSFVIDPAAALGGRTVTVTTPGGTTGTQPFTITAPAPGVPTLTSVVPIQGTQGTTVAVTLTGTNFAAPATVAVSGAGVTAGPANVVGPTSLTTSFVIDPAAAVGARTVTVTTPGGTTGTQPFTIIAPPPTLTVMNPVTGVRGTQVSIVVLVGSGFITGGTTVNFGADVTVDFTQVQSDAIVAVAITILATASVGPRPVTVTTINGTSNALDFTITAPLPPPTLGFMDPVTGARGAVLVVTLVGTGFVSGLGGTTANFGAGVTVGLVLVGNATSLATQISIALGAAIGSRSVTVMTANGTSNALTFNVT